MNRKKIMSLIVSATLTTTIVSEPLTTYAFNQSEKNLNSNVKTEIVNIEDNNFKKYLNSLLGQAEADDITKTQMESLTGEIKIPGDVTNITGIRYATNAKSIDVGPSNKISDISELGYLTELKGLNLRDSKLEDTSTLRKLTNLEQLVIDVKYNKKMLNDISGLINLKRLLIDNGNEKIDNLDPINKLINLEEIIVRNNTLSNINALKNMNNLKIVDFDGNNINDISSLSGKQITKLELYNNKIMDISPLQGMVSLIDLNLGANQISDISYLKDCINLEVLQIGSNKRISNIEVIQNMKKMRKLDAYQLPLIKEITVLETLTALEYLRVDQCGISDITPLKELTNLKTLNIGQNKDITNIYPLSKSVQLNKLDARNCSIEDISVISNFNKLHDLLLDQNKIKDITPISNINSLRDLSLNGNKISDVSQLGKISKLNYIHLGLQYIELPEIETVEGKNAESFNIVRGLQGEEIKKVSSITGGGKYDSASSSVKWDKIINSDTQSYTVNSGNVYIGGKSTLIYWDIKQPIKRIDGNLPNIFGVDNKNIKAGNSFNELEGITANDVEDGDLTTEVKVISNNVDITNPGEYEVVYSVTDSWVNTVNVTRIINVLTNDGAVINGANDVTIKVGEVDSFDPKAGVTVTDDHDSLTIDNVTITGAVSKPTGGKNESYELTYTVTDSDGNVTTVKRLVTVTNEVPVIAGLTDITIKKGQSANVETGVTASDNEDGDITGNIVLPTTDLTGLAEGTHEIEYSVTDSDGNTTTEKRTVNVESNNAPVISGADDITIKIGDLDSFDLKAGITVTDDHDSLTIDNITIAGVVGKPQADSSYTTSIKYTVTDSDGNTTTVDRWVTVTNSVPKLWGLYEFFIREGTTVDIQANVTANDREDGDLTGNIVFPTTDTATLSVGTHEIEYSVTDSDGNTTTKKRTVNVESNNAPVISGADDITIKIGELDSFDPEAGITITDDHDSLTMGDVTITGAFGKPTAGTNESYELIYTVTDDDGNVTTVKRLVTVTNQRPTILGLDKITIRKGYSFDIKAGVTANDLEDGDITVDIKYPTKVWKLLNRKSLRFIDTLDVGIYELKYSVTDSDGNTTEVMRDLEVVSNEAPVIAGANDVTIKVGEVDSFDPKAGITVTDDHDSLTIDDVKVTGIIEKPVAGANKNYELTYTVTDSDGNVITVKRLVTVTNEVPVIAGLTDITIRKGETSNIETGVTANDNEDGDITANIVFPTTDLTGLAEGTHEIEYSVTDSDGNTTTEKRIVNVESNSAAVINGANDVTIKVGEVDSFDSKAGVTVTDDHDSLTIDNVTITGAVGKPTGGKNESYELTYTVTDSDGNVTTVKRLVTVTNEVPVIEGLTDITIKKGQSANVETGVTASDNEDGDITGSIVFPTTDLTGLAEGTHEIEYTATDADGNTTIEKRKVIVESNNAPVISGADDVTIKVGEMDTFDKMAGISVTDDHDSLTVADITWLGSGWRDKPMPGTEKECWILYEVTDSDGNETSVRRYVTVTNQLPVIEGLTDITIKEGETIDLVTGVISTDQEDGDITGKLVIPTIDTSIPGEYELVYTITDSDGNTTTVIRKVIVNQKLVEMNSVPTITGDNKTLKVGDLFDTMMGISAMDNEDGDITGAITIIENTVDTSRVGIYKVVYQVVDSAGAKVTKTISVTIRSNDIAVISGADDITIVQGDAFDSANGVTAMDTEDGNITPSMSITGNVDINTPGEYELIYTVTDSDGNTTTVIRKVIVNKRLVEMNNVPIITGDNKTLKVGDLFDTMMGISAMDNEDGDITGSITIIENTVDTSRVGTYKVVYQVVDSAGAKVTKTISVTVRSNDKAVISGADDITIVQGDAFDSANGVTAMDTEDGNITASMSITGTVDINNPGEYELVYTITDSDGNITTLIRKVIVQQKLVDINKIPVIFAEGIKIEVGSHFDPLSKVRAEDEEDGDITSKIKIIENTVNTNKAGVYSVTYEVTDSNGATVRKTIVITVEDKKIIIPNEENNNNNDNKNDNNNKNNTENRVTITKVSSTKKNQEKNVTTNRDDKKSEADKDSTSEGEDKEKNPKKPELGYEDGAEDENCMLHWLLLLLSVGTLGGTLVSRYRFNQKIKKECGEDIDSTNGK